MASSERYFTDIKKMVFNKRLADRLVMNKKEYMQAVYNGELVFNRAFYHLSIGDDVVRFTARGGNFSDDSPKDQMLLKCYKEDYGGPKLNQYDLEFNPSSVEPNQGSSEVNGTFRVTHILSGLYVEGSWVQDADSVASVTYREISVTDVIYPVIPASGGTVAPFIYYAAVRVATYVSGREDTSTVELLATDIYYMEGRTAEPHVTLNTSNGAVTAESLGTKQYDSEFPIAQITLLRATDINGDALEWKDHVALQVLQAKNQPTSNGTSYDINADVPQNGGTISSSAQTITIYIEAWKTTEYKWDSGAESSGTSAHTVFITASTGTLSSISASGSQDVTLSIPQNGTLDRNITIRVYSSAAGYDKTFTIKQEAFVEVEYWAAPTLDGTVPAILIPANGSGVPVRIPIVQNKYKGSTVIETYRATVNAVAITGSAVSGTGAAFSNGIISCDSMGTKEYKEGRAVYYIATATVVGKDGESYQLTGLGTPEVRQDVNVKSLVGYGDYVLSVSASPSSGIPAIGGTSTITASAQLEEVYTWSSGADGGTTLVNSNGNLSVSPSGYARISPDSIMGVNQKATLTVTSENMTIEPRVLTVTLAVGDANATCQVVQEASSYPIEVWKYSDGKVCVENNWYLGQLPTGNAVDGGIPTYHIVVATTAEYKDNDAQIYADFGYAYTTSGGDRSGTYKNSVYYKGGTEVVVDGKVYYAVILVEDLREVSQGDINSFTVMGGGGIT